MDWRILLTTFATLLIAELGDKVRVELSPYDLEKRRIVYRYKPHQV